MPLPIILGVAATIAGVAGVGSGIHGAVKMKEANDTMESAKRRHEKNISRLEKQSKSTNEVMDELGMLELHIINSFGEFSDTIERIQNRPQFKEYTKEGVTLPKYDKEELKDISVGAGVLLGGLGGAVAGTAGGFAAAGATTSAVMALGTASTGTAIASLSGVAATNATLAALGGGALSVGGGGMALGSAVLGGATLGVGLLVGGIIFNAVGGNLSDKADEAWGQMKKAEEKINKIEAYLIDLGKTAQNYNKTLKAVRQLYQDNFGTVSHAVNELCKTDWNSFSESEKIATQNSIMLVGLLNKMCKVSLVKKAVNENEMNAINEAEVTKAISDSQQVCREILVNTY